MKMKLLSHLMKLFYLMTLPSQQFYLCDILFNVHDTLMKHILRLGPCLVPQKLCKNFQIPRHIKIFRRMHGVLNIDENKN